MGACLKENSQSCIAVLSEQRADRNIFIVQHCREFEAVKTSLKTEPQTFQSVLPALDSSNGMP